jgi:hypothetical protein
MRIAIDFDGTIVRQNRAYFDTTTPLEFMPGAKKALAGLKKAGHELYLWSARANLALRGSWQDNPAWTERPDWLTNEAVVTNNNRYLQMRKFADEQLPGIFTYIDNGDQGKILADMFIDDRNYPLVGVDWQSILDQFGPDADAADTQQPDDSPT